MSEQTIVTRTAAPAATTANVAENTLGGVRRRFIELTGRKNLLVGGRINEDKGANNYINAGQTHLDGRLDLPESRERVRLELDTGEYQVQVERLYNLESLRLITSSGAIDLTKKRVKEQSFKSQMKAPFSAFESGTPANWTFSTVSINRDNTLAADPGGDDLLTGSSHQYKVILFDAKADEDIIVEILGRFQSETLVSDDDTTFWVENFPEMSAIAAAFMSEKDHSDGARYNLYANMLNFEIQRIDDISAVNEMSGTEIEMEPNYTM